MFHENERNQVGYGRDIVKGRKLGETLPIKSMLIFKMHELNEVLINFINFSYTALICFLI